MQVGGDAGEEDTGAGPPSSIKTKYIDVGANLLDERFTKGVYRGTYRHEPDLGAVVDRAVQVGVERILLTAGTLEESRHAVQAVRAFRNLYPNVQWGCTVGVHPTRCQQEFVESEVDGEQVLLQLLEVAQDGMNDGSVLAIGEMGLDYDRLEFAPKDVQQHYLVRQLQMLAKGTGLPLFLHNRSAQHDLYDILLEHRDCWDRSSTHRRFGGVVHSFDDTYDLAQQFMDLGFMIGINGCSLKTDANVDVVSKLPLDRILLETDCPYCEIRSTHASYKHVQTSFVAKAEKKFEMGVCVKNRQEPCHIVQVAEAVAGIKGLPVSDVATACYDNTIRVFYSCEDVKEGQAVTVSNTEPVPVPVPSTLDGSKST